jgi:hypothetical protein
MKLTLSQKAHSDMNLWIRSFHPYAVRHNDCIDLDSTNQIFNDLDEMYGGLIPQQDLDTETYAWVCSYGGSNFYISQTPDEDSQATITIEDVTTSRWTTKASTNGCLCNTCSCNRKVIPSQDI